MTVRVAVVGSGPAGFFACEELLKHDGFEVDLYDALPTPFGLVRAGVAPDHPKIKAVTRVYEKTAKKDGFRFFGGLVLGRDVTRAELLERYHAVVTRWGPATTTAWGSRVRTAPASTARRSSWPGTTAIRTPLITITTCRASVRSSSETATSRSTSRACCR